MRTVEFCLGLTAGIGLSSLLWVLYISYFLEDAAAMGEKVRTWLKSKRPW